MATASVAAFGPAGAPPTDDRQHVRTFESGQAVQSSQGQGSVDSPLPVALPLQPPLASGHSSMPWNSSHGMYDNFGVDGSNVLNSSYYQQQQRHQQHTIVGVQAGQAVLNLCSSASAESKLTSENVYQGYNEYASSYTSVSNHYAYGSTSYPGYNYGYQQQGNHSYSQHVGAYQNSGASYQPVNSFQNASSHTDSTNYPSATTYYNTGVYQNSGGYRSTGYSGHTGSWGESGYGNYGVYSNYSGITPSDSSEGVCSANQSQYQLEYQQWADYYGHAGSDSSRAPGTESTACSSTSTPSSLHCPIPGFSTGASAAITQPPPPGTQPSWKLNVSSSCEASLSQEVTENGGIMDITTMGSYKNEENNHNEALHFQQALHRHYLPQPSPSQPAQYPQTQEQQLNLLTQGQKVQTPPYQASHRFPSPVQSITSIDASQKRMGKLQIPTNPRIAVNLAIGKDSVQEACPTQKPAYTSVNIKAAHHKASSNDVADALKPGMFPPSLFHYVERALVACKDEAQKVACQDRMKEMIIKASADGSLFTTDWDTEPVFPLPSSSTISSRKENMQNSMTVGSLPKCEHGQGKRVKSRWEPVADEKLDEKQGVPLSHEFNREVVWGHLKEGQNKLLQGSVKWDTKDGVWNGAKELQLHQPLNSINTSKRAAKKARKGNGLDASGGGDSSSEIDEEAGHGGSCFASRGLADTQEEMKRRQNRTKRFDKENETNTKTKGPIMKTGGASSGSARGATALLLAKNYGDSGGRAVEDIDWDSLTVKGTCQEIEKCYLRLTSAPDPNTVRPEEVLQKALVMVKNSTKNYLYKCEQLKSIRQDLTVQRIRNELTAKVYETHARLALEAGDMPEYNQCQSQLEGLYAEGIEGSHHEFRAYQLLYSTLNSGNSCYLLSSMARLSEDAKKDEVVKHALAVRAAVASWNYTAFFRLYRAASHLSACLMDLHVEKMRYEAVRCMSRSYRPTVPIAYIAQILAFTSVVSSRGSEEELDGLDECEEWLRAHGAILVRDMSTGEFQLNAKDTAACLSMPVSEDAVPHGDAYLAVNDFLART